MATHSTTQQQTGQDARGHARELRTQMDDLARQLRDGIGKVDDPQAKALFETSREVMEGLTTAFEHYEQRSEDAWR